MGKMKVIVFLIITLGALYIGYRLLFRFTIISIPITTNAYVGGAKEQFDFSVLNPFKKKQLNSIYRSYIEAEIKVQQDKRILSYYNSIYKSGFEIKNLREEKDRVVVYIEHINKNGQNINGFFIFDKQKNAIIKSEP